MIDQIMVWGGQRERLHSGYARGLLGIFEDLQHAQIDSVLQMFFGRRVRNVHFSLYSMLMRPYISFNA